ncbi:MAG: exodeoxyribonuclease VII large subunit [Spirochaeta sp. LUC14_002_19_P3]|nr:MAG: exodeoxyribonuclease VII large subunit [Spirochaeta sp. LUC14_002_19_P3]
MPGSKPIWTVSEITNALKEMVQEEFPFIEVEGEISNYRPSGVGHVYFTLKDAGAVIAAALFRGRSEQIQVKPADGMKVIASGQIDIYPPRGTYQLIVENLREAGRGHLLETLEERKRKLAAEGLFDQARKKALPPYPRHVAVITSPTGAALRDILQVLNRRSAAPRITVLPTLVQGGEAAQMIADQLRRAAVYNLGEVVILARGGGSLEDLMPFNEEVVVRAIAECPLPVISGVGHEVDVTLADLAADIRAATPSAAAELVSDRSEDLLLRVKGFRREAADILQNRLSQTRRRLDRADRPALLDLLRSKLMVAMRRADEAQSALRLGANKHLDALNRRRELALRSIMDSSPHAILARGYARITRKSEDIASAAMLSAGDNIDIHFAEDRASAVIKNSSSPKTPSVEFLEAK